MTWVAVMVLAAVGFVVAAGLLALPRAAYALLGVGLALGLAGYAWQGSADMPGAPTEARIAPPRDGEGVIVARRAMFGGSLPAGRYVTVSDGFARQGQTQDAIDFLKLAVRQNPRDAEAWVAMGNLLVAHAQGNLTPAAIEAYTRAERAAPASPAPHYFAGLALLRVGRGAETRQAWAAALQRIPADAPYRSIVADQLAELDRTLRSTPSVSSPATPSRSGTADDG